MDGNSLWSKVIKSRFGEIRWSREGERRGGKGRRRVGWWKSIVEVVEGDDGKWFWDSLEVKLGDGKSSRFWDGMWSGTRSLKEIFSETLSTKFGKERNCG